MKSDAVIGLEFTPYSSATDECVNFTAIYRPPPPPPLLHMYAMYRVQRSSLL